MPAPAGRGGQRRARGETRGRGERTPPADTDAPLLAWRGGVHVLNTRVWCDALRLRDPGAVCFVSSAQIRIAAEAPGTILCTERTLRLRKALLGETPGALLSPMGRPFSLGTLRLELFPSGALPGAAALWLRLPSGRCVVHAGALGPAGAALAEPVQVRPADALVVHAPLAALADALPSREEALAAVRAALVRGREAGALTVLLADTLTTAPELLHALADPELEVYGHARIERVVRAFRQLGITIGPAELAPRRVLRALPAKPPSPGSVLIWPLGVPLRELVARTGNAKLHVVLCAGAAASAEATAGLRAALAEDGLTLAAAIAFAEGADLPALCSYAAETEASELHLTAGFTPAVADAVRAAAAARGRKVVVAPLGGPRQLPLFAAQD